jgi:hypothetical protein
VIFPLPSPRDYCIVKLLHFTNKSSIFLLCIIFTVYLFKVTSFHKTNPFQISVVVYWPQVLSKPIPEWVQTLGWNTASFLSRANASTVICAAFKNIFFSQLLFFSSLLLFVWFVFTFQYGAAVSFISIC